jgi:hypothetical protein
LKPAWSIVFRWPDGPRDCEAVAVDAAHGEVLLVSKRHRPPELFVLPLRPATRDPQVARRVGFLAGVPGSGSHAERLLGQVTAADLSPDGRTLAVLTYRDVLLYHRAARQPWPGAVARNPQVRPLTWLPQAEALAWASDGEALYASGEHSPAPLLYLNP